VTKKTAKESLQKALAPPTQAFRTIQPTTKPAEFHFAVDDRIKKNTVDTRRKAEAAEFVSGLRKHDAAVSKILIVFTN